MNRGGPPPPHGGGHRPPPPPRHHRGYGPPPPPHHRGYGPPPRGGCLGCALPTLTAIGIVVAGIVTLIISLF